jgi:hypothetical protein
MTWYATILHINVMDEHIALVISLPLLIGPQSSTTAMLCAQGEEIEGPLTKGESSFSSKLLFTRLQRDRNELRHALFTAPRHRQLLLCLSIHIRGPDNTEPQVQALGWNKALVDIRTVPTHICSTTQELSIAPTLPT